METQKFPKNFTDLPVIHVYGSARLIGGRRLIIAGLFLMLLCVYHVISFDSYWYESPTYYIKWIILYNSFPSDFWWGVLAVIILVPWACSVAGFLIFTFSPNATKKIGRVFSIASLISLQIWHHFKFRGYHLWYKYVIAGPLEYWLLFGLFVLILIVCWERKRKSFRQAAKA